MKQNLPTIGIAAILVLTLGFVPSPVDADENGSIYGSQLMTPKERAEHREKMRSFKSDQKREAYRQEHHRRMQERAEKRGITLPDEPPSRGKGMGKGRGPRPGQGPGPGYGPGPGSGPGHGGGMGSGGGHRN